MTKFLVYKTPRIDQFLGFLDVETKMIMYINMNDSHYKHSGKWIDTSNWIKMDAINFNEWHVIGEIQATSFIIEQICANYKGNK